MGNEGYASSLVPWRGMLLYLVLGVAWVFAGDVLLAHWVTDPALRQRILHLQRIVAHDLHLCPQLAQVMDEVPGETVVVVDQKQHIAVPCRKGDEASRGSRYTWAGRGGEVKVNSGKGSRWAARETGGDNPRRTRQGGKDGGVL